MEIERTKVANLEAERKLENLTAANDPCPLGHAKLETTALYTRVAVSTIREVKSPLNSDAKCNPRRH